MTTHSSEAHSSSRPTVYVPGDLVPKLVFLVLSLLLFGVGVVFVWEPLGRLLTGKTELARVAEIRVIEPGQPEIVYKYRRAYPPESNLAVTFQHYVSVSIDGQPVLYRISVDSRKAPMPDLNVNDLVNVTYDPKDKHRLAFAYTQERTWGLGGLIVGLGLLMLSTAIPMLLATGKPIAIDPDAASAEPQTP
jgi:hypothetical protein